jgi:hypothetical protein
LEPLPECRKLGRRFGIVLSIVHQHADASQLVRLLRFGRERHESETDSENDREPDQSHRHLGGGWLAGSLADEVGRRELAALVEHALFDDLIGLE